ncbi:hypothetical protein JQX13_11270 [Archangium violaceum]|uniref:hypothetical protein n=1 Tax=Archangium violaceum TaxID=83451 RepID=UPI00193B3C15|nr:hypothetical protein [Archangium violaceum]QRK10609.1 hypothetical protein JQX13_11270 [Archangium violaceum]
MPQQTDTLELLLVHADTNTPVLSEGLPAGTTPQERSTMKDDVPEPLDFWDEGGDPNDLEAQRWGLILPEGPEGDRLRDLIRPLIEFRRAQQGGHPVKEYRVPKGPMTMAEAALWRKRHFDSGEHLSADVPRYQLILGDFDQVPLAIQQIQASDGYVGRLHFSDEQGYLAYVEKVLRAERLPRQGLGRMLFHTAHDGTPALNAGFNALINPGLELIREGLSQGRFPASGLHVHGEEQEPGLDRFLENSSLTEPGVLFSMSHGIGAPRGGWKTDADRLAGQGAMSFGREGQLSASDLTSRTFMPNGIWFMFACFGAGTPDISAYSHWLRHLVEAGRYSRLPDVMKTLAGTGRPFVAATPQKVLANPNGPLAFIGHVDLAWTFSFREDDSPAKKRPGRFIEPLKSMLRSNRVGIGFRELYRYLALTDTELSSIHDDDVRTGATASNDELIRRGYLWMMRQDIAGYVMLGDPAVRLPVEERRAKLATPPALPVPHEVVKAPAKLPLAVEKLEEAIGYILSGERSMKELSTEYGIERRELERLADIYCKAGRAALGIPE